MSLPQLNPGEELKLNLRPTGKVLIPAVIVMLILAPIPIVDFLDILIFLSIIWVYFSQVRARRFLVTTDRIILGRKFLAKDRRDIYYENMQDVVLDQGIWGRIFGYGAIQPVTLGNITLGGKSSPGLQGKSNARTLYRLGGLSHPDEVLNTIQSLLHAKRPQSRQYGAIQ